MIAKHRKRNLLGLIGLASLISILGSCSPTSGSVGTGDEGTITLGAGVSDGSVFNIIGPQGGPFPQGTRTYTLQNFGSEVVQWSMDAEVTWLTTTPNGGILTAGASTEVTVEIDQAQAAGLPEGAYPSNLTLRTLSNAAGDIFIPFQLSVGPPSRGILQIRPESELTIQASSNNASSGSNGTVTITNSGNAALHWSLTSEDAWLVIETPNNEPLEPGETQEVSLAVDEVILGALGGGTYDTQLTGEMVPRSGEAHIIDVTVEFSEEEGRITNGLLAEYHFEEGGGSVVQDISGVSPALDLTIEDPNSVTWLPGGISITNPTLLATPGPATRATQSIQQSGEITVEAWLRPSSLNQDGPARIFGISNGPSLRNFTLGQGLWGSQPKDTFNMRIRTSATDLDGMPLLTTSAGSVSLGLQHVVYSRRADGLSRLFVNGQVAAQNQLGGDMDNWDTSYRMAIAGEIGASRPWLGDLFLMAIYDRALTPAEINQNRLAGSGAAEVGQLCVTPNAQIQVTATLGQGIYMSVDEFDLSNLGSASLEWSAGVNQPWVSLASANGTLAPEQGSTTGIQLDQAQIMALPPGSYAAVANFTNNTSSYGTTEKSIHLRVITESGPGSGERPGPQNTGPSDPSILDDVGGLTITQDGTVLENVFVHGTIFIEANNVTIRNFKVDPGNTPYAIRATGGHSGIVIEDGELFNVDSAHIYGGGFEARRLNLHDSGGDGFKCTNDVVVEECWVHHLGTKPGAHSDCNQTRSGNNFIFRRNFMDLPIDIGAPYKQNAAFIMQTGDGPIDNILIEDNWLDGGNFTVYIENKLPPPGSSRPNYGNPTNARLLNNRFGRNYRYGVLNITGYVLISGNRWDDNDELMSINNE
ncbi:MAG: LamG domain-containing protein [bacterium]|nr:LamG domain-containing protein [bacterium]